MAQITKRGCPKCHNVWEINTAFWSDEIRIKATVDVNFEETQSKEGIAFKCKKCKAVVAKLTWVELES